MGLFSRPAKEEDCLCLEALAGGAPIRVGQLLSLGRAPGNDVRFPETEPGVSLHHASLILRNGCVTLRDLESANGTWMGETRVKECEIREGQEFSLGRNGPRFRLARRSLPKAAPQGTIVLGEATSAYVQHMAGGDGNLTGWTRFDAARQKKILLWFGRKNRKQKKLTVILASLLAVFAGLSLWLFIQVIQLKAQVALHKELVEQLVPGMDPKARHEAVLKIRAQEKELAGLRSRLREFAMRGIYSDALALKLHKAAESFGEEGFILPDAFVATAKQHYNDLMSAYGRKKVAEALARKKKYDEMIRAELSGAGLPASLIYLAMHESRFDSLAVSPVGARGLWQLMPSLAGEFQLAVPSDWRSLPPGKDPRTRPGPATRAGVGQLRKLFDRYDDPFLAMAAYNSGESQLNSALRRMKESPGAQGSQGGQGTSPGGAASATAKGTSGTAPASTSQGGAGPATAQAADWAADDTSTVDEAIARVADARFKSDYWYLQRMNLLPAETARYVPFIVATMVAAQDAGE